MDNCIVMHPYVQAELVLGGLSNTTKELINSLNFCKVYDSQLVLNFIEEKHLVGKGIGLVDTTLIFTCIIENLKLFTYDSKLLKLNEYFKNHFYNI